MNNQNTATNAQAKKWRSWLILFLRWLLGGAIGFGLSAWICLGYITNNTTANFGIITMLFTGPLLLFDPSFLGNEDFIDFLVRSFPNIDHNFLVVSLPSIIWGFIGALLASGRKEQIKSGAILLVVYVIVGFYAFFRMLMMVPT